MLAIFAHNIVPVYLEIESKSKSVGADGPERSVTTNLNSAAPKIQLETRPPLG